MGDELRAGGGERGQALPRLLWGLRPVSLEHLLLFRRNFKAAWLAIPGGSWENRVHEAAAPLQAMGWQCTCLCTASVLLLTNLFFFSPNLMEV